MTKIEKNRQINQINRIKIKINRKRVKIMTKIKKFSRILKIIKN